MSDVFSDGRDPLVKAMERSALAAKDAEIARLRDFLHEIATGRRYPGGCALVVRQDCERMLRGLPPLPCVTE